MVDGIQELVDVLQTDTAEPSKTYSAEVSKIDNAGTVWVYLEGSTKETPTATTSAEVNVGDFVNVEWRNNKLYIAGNVSNPSAGSIRVNAVEQAAQVANQAAQNAVTDAGVARQAAESAQADAVAASQAVITVNNNLKSVVQGATTVEKAVSVMQTALEAVVDYDPQNDTTQEYFWHDANGAHVLGTSGDYRADIKSTGMNIVDTATENPVATFGTETSIRTSDGTELAHFGYDLGQAQSGTAVAPYYTLGKRKNNSTIGNYSVAEGDETTASRAYSHAEGVHATASGSASHAEGWYTTASGEFSHAEGSYTTASSYASHAEGYRTTAESGWYSHAEGGLTTASGNESHAEGYRTTASGDYSHAEGGYTTASRKYSHAEGWDTTASGSASHAGGYRTIATGNNQTVIGKYNKATVSGSGTTQDPYVYTDVGDYAFIIGNGSENTTANRSNAFTVDWNGNVDIALDTTAQSGIDYDIYSALQTLGWDSEVII